MQYQPTVIAGYRQQTNYTMIYYNKVQRRNPQDPEGARKWYVTLKSRLQVSERELAEEIADEVTLNPKEAEMAFYQLFKVAVRALTDGKTVKLGDLGTIYLTVSSEGADTREEVTAQLVKAVRVRFMPSETLREAIAKATFACTETLLNDAVEVVVKSDETETPGA